MQEDIKSLQQTIQSALLDTTHIRSDEELLSSLIVGTPGLDWKKRINIYATAYFLRLEEVMKNDFELTAHLLGDDKFEVLMEDFLKDHPSTSPLIGDLGVSFPQFIALHKFNDEINGLSDVALMEWFINEAIYSDITQQSLPDNMSEWTEDEWSTATFTLAPSLRWFKSHWDLPKAWEQYTSDESVILKIENESEYGVMIFMKDFEISVERCPVGSITLIELIKKGLSLSEIAAAIEKGGSIELMEQLGRWVAEKKIIGIQRHTNH